MVLIVLELHSVSQLLEPLDRTRWVRLSLGLSRHITGSSPLRGGPELNLSRGSGRAVASEAL